MVKELRPQKIKTQIQALLEEACHLTEKQRYGEALPLYEQALQLDPCHGPAQLGKAKTLYVLERYPESLETLAKIEKTNPSLLDKQALQQRADMLTKQELALKLQRFLTILATNNSAAIIKAYNTAFKSQLNKEELQQLEKARKRQEKRLRQRMQEAIKQDNDNAILDIQKDIKTSQLSIQFSELERKRIQQATERKELERKELERKELERKELERKRIQQAAERKELERKRIQQATERKAAVERLKQVLQKGTPHQKVEAFHALSSDQNLLSVTDQQQINIAYRLIEALKSNDKMLIRAAYDALQDSHLSQHFSFTDDQQFIKQIEAEYAAVKALRTILQGSNINISQAIQMYQRIRSPQNFLTPDDRQILEAAQKFSLHISKNRRKKTKADIEQIIHLYNELFFSPYLFQVDEERYLIENKKLGLLFISRPLVMHVSMRSFESKHELLLLHNSRPLIMQVNMRTIDMTQFLALYTMKPRYARWQISLCQQNMAVEPSEVKRQCYKDGIAFWEQQIERFNLPGTTIADLIHQVLIEQGISEEPEKIRCSLEKAVQETQVDLCKKVPFPSRDKRILPIPLRGNEQFKAYLPYALNYVFTQHLQKTAPGQTLESWLKERLKNSTISYYTYPDKHAPMTQDWQEIWLLKWWYLRQRTKAPQSKEVPHV